MGADPDTDLAVVEIQTEEELPSVPLGSSGDLLIGETVIAIGNPFGLGHTVTTGVLSAANRSISADQGHYHGFLQTDASINPGNSGGPLVNINGEVIGINTAIFREAEGIGFAIPIDRARRIAAELIRHGEVIPVWLGLRLQPLDDDLRETLGVEARWGVLVSHVFKGSPASRAGIRRGDVLLSLGGTRLQQPRNYFEVLASLPEGSRAELRLERERRTLELALHTETFSDERADQLAEILIGISVASGRDPRPGLEIRKVEPNSSAGRIGLEPGDHVVAVNRERVSSVEQFRRAISKLRGRRQVVLLVERGGRGYQLSLGLS